MNMTADLIERQIADVLDAIPRNRSAISRCLESKNALELVWPFQMIFENYLLTSRRHRLHLLPQKRTAPRADQIGS